MSDNILTGEFVEAYHLVNSGRPKRTDQETAIAHPVDKLAPYIAAYFDTLKGSPFAKITINGYLLTSYICTTCQFVKIRHGSMEFS